ncbi:YihY/virulence factor BrkB family protein [Sphingomonas sp. BN140010]|uniref:YihY/virulence factor BrkB family protein n=1 Tax=Sphingomonas arvum TaxID=2992113 RepID=A0ABT3JDX6_9SPHN|nr:YihY/virulence factor BrkB family protein [Sphingomonas sp. BN140010]MCW3797272.1 YihY/virulence factor BrkB family protein [Sphingomonas sp. BN140010]
MATAARPPADSPQADHGRTAEKPTEIPVVGWKEIALRSWKEGTDDNIGLVAAGVAFYGFLALVPLLGATVLTYGLVAEPQTVLRHAGAITNMLPGEAGQLISQQLIQVVQTSGGKKGLGLLLALAIALWGARNAAGSVVIALNIAYEEKETRGFIKKNVLALLMTIGAVLLALLAGGAMGVLAGLEKLLPDIGPVGSFLAKLLTYAVLGAIAAAAVATLFRYAPARDKAKWTWLTPGSIAFAVGWIVLTLAFGIYVRNFGNYGATYGSLSAIVVMLTWLYLSAYLLLFAAEINSELEHQTEKDTTSGADKPLGARNAWSADHVAAGKTAAGEEEERKPDDAAQAPPVRQPVRLATSSGEPVGDDAGHPYLVSRVSSRAGQLAGARKISMVSSGLATLGLGMLKKRGREKTGAALLATAAGLALLRRR